MRFSVLLRCSLHDQSTSEANSKTAGPGDHTRARWPDVISTGRRDASLEVPVSPSAHTGRAALSGTASPSDDPASAFLAPLRFSAVRRFTRLHPRDPPGVSRPRSNVPRNRGAAAAGCWPPGHSRAAYQARGRLLARPCPNDSLRVSVRAALMGFMALRSFVPVRGQHWCSPPATPHMPFCGRPPR